MSSLRASFFPIDINDLQLFSALQITTYRSLRKSAGIFALYS